LVRPVSTNLFSRARQLLVHAIEERFEPDAPVVSNDGFGRSISTDH